MSPPMSAALAKLRPFVQARSRVSEADEYSLAQAQSAVFVPGAVHPCSLLYEPLDHRGDAVGASVPYMSC